MLSISNLHVAIDDKPILKGLTLDVPAFETLAILPNGAGALASCYDRDRRRP